MDKKIWKLERPWVTINKDKNVLKLPSGVWMDWSEHGKNVDEAIDMYNDFAGFGKYALGVGAALGVIATGGLMLTIHRIKAKKAKKQEETEESEEEA